MCGVEDPFEFEFYPAAKSAQPKTSEKKTENERLDAIAPRAVRVDGLRLKPRGEAELKPGALVDIGLEATALADPVATFGKSQKKKTSTKASSRCTGSCTRTRERRVSYDGSERHFSVDGLRNARR